MVGRSKKKPWQWGGGCSVFWSGFFSGLSGIAPCQTCGTHLTWPHGPPVSKAFFGPFLCAKVFLDPFCVVGRSKKNLGSGGAGVPSF